MAQSRYLNDIGSMGLLEATYGEEDSFQLLAADLTLTAEAGSSESTEPKYLAPVMGNVFGADLEKTANAIAGLIGKYSITGTNASTYPKGAVIAEIGEDTTTADGAVVAVLGGDTGTASARAAYTVDNHNSNATPKFTYGIDLVGVGAHDGYVAVAYTTSPIRAVLPTSDPQVVGAFWSNGGVVTESAG